MSNNSTRRLSTSELAILAFAFLGAAAMACFIFVSNQLLPLKPGWSARITNGLIDVSFAGLALLLASLTCGFIAWRQARIESKAPAAAESTH